VYGHGEKKPQFDSRLGRKLNNVDVATDERKRKGCKVEREREELS
jgi:hypothetical protein